MDHMVPWNTALARVVKLAVAVVFVLLMWGSSGHQETGAGCNATSAVESTVALLVILALLIRLRRKVAKGWAQLLPMAGAALMLAVAAPVAADEPLRAELTFEAGSVGLDKSALIQLDAIARTMSEDPEMLMIIEIAAEDSYRGTDDADLTRARAAAIRDHLVAKGIDKQRVRLPLDELSAVERERPRMRLALITAEPVDDDGRDRGDRAPETRVAAPEVTEVTHYVYVEKTEEIDRPFRFALSGGGGLVRSIGGEIGFGSIWDVRLTAGTRDPIGAELAYVASVQGIDAAMGFGHGAKLMGHGAEGALRLAWPDSDLQPYGFAGVGLHRYDVIDASAEVKADNVVFFPAGLGVAYYVAGRLVLDLRGTGRVAFDDDLFARAGEPAGLDNWSVSFLLGAEL
jgi:hypothetical protein